MFLLRVLIFTLETILYGYQLIHSKSVNRQLVKQQVTHDLQKWDTK